MHPAASRLEVGSCIWTTSRVVVLLEIRLEWRGTGAILWLVSERSASVEVQVVVVSCDLALALLHAPEDESNAAEKEHTTDTANDTTDDLLVGVAESAAVVTVRVLRCWWQCDFRLASRDGNGPCALGGGSGNSPVGKSNFDDACEGFEGSRDKRAA